MKKTEAKSTMKESEGEPKESTPQRETLPNFEESFDDEFDYSSIQKTCVDEGIVIDYMTFAQWTNEYFARLINLSWLQLQYN